MRHTSKLGVPEVISVYLHSCICGMKSFTLTAKVLLVWISGLMLFDIGDAFETLKFWFVRILVSLSVVNFLWVEVD